MKNNSGVRINKDLLQNNLPLLTIDDNYSDSATIMFLVNAGSVADDARFSGTAHFLEHMFFKGSSRYPSSKELSFAVEMIGGLTNAFTSYEYTGYFIKVPIMNLDKALDLLADVIFNPVFNEKDLDKEKGVIAEEIKMYRDLPQEKVRDLFNSNLFLSSPYGNNIAGTLRSIKMIDKNILHDYRQRNYGVGDTLLIISGGIDTKKSFELANKSFGNQKFGKVKLKRNTENAPKLIKKYSIFEKFPSQQAHIIIGGLSEKRNSELEYPLKLGMGILADGFGSKLFQELREKMGIAYYLGGGFSFFKNTGKYSIRAGLSNDNLNEGIESIINGINEIKSGIFTDTDLERAKNYLISSKLEEVETSEDRAYWYGIHDIFKMRNDSPEAEIIQIKNVSKDLITDAWSRIINKGNLMLATVSGKEPEFKINL